MSIELRIPFLKSSDLRRGGCHINLTEGQEVKYFTIKDIKKLHAVPLIKEIFSQNKWQ